MGRLCFVARLPLAFPQCQSAQVEHEDINLHALTRILQPDDESALDLFPMLKEIEIRAMPDVYSDIPPPSQPAVFTGSGSLPATLPRTSTRSPCNDFWMPAGTIPQTESLRAVLLMLMRERSSSEYQVLMAVLNVIDGSSCGCSSPFGRTVLTRVRLDDYGGQMQKS
ncbi:hypothetical protein BJV74DRAFT_837063 [Russula compacta]|nr:hypothetical protein BJV74DRAFT_837063 [Russula compacta]